MTRDTIRSGEDVHDALRELLPWYANGTLDPTEAARAHEHLEGCASCRTELETWRAIGEAAQLTSESEFAPDPEGLENLLERIDPGGSRSGATAQPRRAESLWARLGQQVAELAALPSMARWILVGQTAALVVVLAVPLASRAPDATFETRTTAPVRSDEAELQLVLAADMQLAELQRLVGKIDATIVDGPSPRGVYRLALRGSLDLDAALALLRDEAGVRLAEPLRGPRD